MSRTVRTLAALLAALLLLAACGGGREDREEPDFVLYYLLEGEPVHGSALDWQPYEGEEDPGPEELLDALLAGPTQEGLTSPFPRGVTLRSWSWDEEEPGVLRITLSEQYGALADISLTLADSCIVLTLSQLEEVEGGGDPLRGPQRRLPEPPDPPGRRGPAVGRPGGPAGAGRSGCLLTKSLCPCNLRKSFQPVQATPGTVQKEGNTIEQLSDQHQVRPGRLHPRKRRAPADPHHPVHHLQIRHQRGYGQAV